MKALFILLIVAFNTLSNAKMYHFKINTNYVENKELKHFWKSTGFSPLGDKTSIEKYILSVDEKVNLALIGALPCNGIEIVRIHWLLNLLRINPDNKIDFKYLNELLLWMKKQHLQLGFEMMGTPITRKGESIYNKSTNYWYDLSKVIVGNVKNYVGVGEISKVRFETWNEPDLKGYNILNFTSEEYIAHVKAISNGLKYNDENSNYSINFGGPAGLFKRIDHHPLCWNFLKNICDSNQMITNKTIPNCIQLSYLSYHRKGNGTASEVLRGGLELLDEIYAQHPHLKQIPIANDEADIQVNWSQAQQWRGDVTYAALIVRVIIEHYVHMMRGRNVSVALLSNDNGFINYHPYYFTQRTLLTRFQMNNTAPPHVQFVKKPVYAVMGLLSLLGDQYLCSSPSPPPPPPARSDPRDHTAAVSTNNRSYFTPTVAHITSSRGGSDNEELVVAKYKAASRRGHRTRCHQTRRHCHPHHEHHRLFHYGRQRCRHDHGDGINSSRRVITASSSSLPSPLTWSNGTSGRRPSGGHGATKCNARDRDEWSRVMMTVTPGEAGAMGIESQDVPVTARLKGRRGSGRRLTMLTTCSRKNGFRVASIISYVKDKATLNYRRQSKQQIKVNFTDLLSQENVNNVSKVSGKYVIYIMDNILTNPYNVWLKLGKPFFPNASSRHAMRSAQEPFRLKTPVSITKTSLQLNLSIRLPSVVFIHICMYQDNRPGPVTDLQLIRVFEGEVLIVWKDNKLINNCILTYEVQYEEICGNIAKPFRRLNKQDIIFLSYQHNFDFISTENPVSVNSSLSEDNAQLKSSCSGLGNYRVRAVDYWNRLGAYSPIVNYKG